MPRSVCLALALSCLLAAATLHLPVVAARGLRQASATASAFASATGTGYASASSSASAVAVSGTMPTVPSPSPTPVPATADTQAVPDNTGITTQQTCADDDVPPTKEFSCAQQKAWGKCEMCWLVRKGYCRYTCGLCGVDMAVTPCTQDPNASAQEAPDANDAPIKGDDTPATTQSAPAAPATTGTTAPTSGTTTATPAAPTAATSSAAATTTSTAAASSSATASAQATASAGNPVVGSGAAPATGSDDGVDLMDAADAMGYNATECAQLELEYADDESYAEAVAACRGIAAAMATHGGTALSQADTGVAASRADGQATALSKTAPGSATAAAVAGSGGSATSAASS